MILEIEVQGAMKIKEQYPDAILLFITAPSIEVLKNRLIGRGTETSRSRREENAKSSGKKQKVLNSMSLSSATKKVSLKIV